MHLMLIESVRPGACTAARPIYGTMGQPIADIGTPLTLELINELKRYGIDKVVVLDEETRDVRFDELMDSQAWIRLVHAIRYVYLEACSGRFAKAELDEAAASIACHVSAHSTVVPLPSRSIPVSLQIYAHVVNVAIWAAQAADKLGWEEDDRLELIRGCLLHDVGKLLTDTADTEHPLVGYLFAKSHYPAGSFVPHIILQHQNVAGDQYRRSTADKPYAHAAKLCYLCNLFDHLSDVSETMYYGALEVLLALPDRLFAARETLALAASIPKILPGSTVRTPSGRTALVVKLSDRPSSPLLRLNGTDQLISLDEQELASVEFVRL
jgi:putative nucleotidyltransferase with HDIG domain